MVWIIAFFTNSLFSLYPALVFIPDSDIVRLYSESNKLFSSSDLFVSDYPWFHFPMALVLQLSHVSMSIFQTGTAFLSILLICSFYIVAKSYLRKLDDRAPIISTVIFSVFSGFGWFYFLHKIIYSPDMQDTLQLLQQSYGATYWDIGYGQIPWL